MSRIARAKRERFRDRKGTQEDLVLWVVKVLGAVLVVTEMKTVKGVTDMDQSMDIRNGFDGDVANVPCVCPASRSPRLR